MLVFTQERERKARRKGKALQSEETSAPSAAEEEEMEGSGTSGNEEEAPEDGEGRNNTHYNNQCHRGQGAIVSIPSISTVRILP